MGQAAREAPVTQSWWRFAAYEVRDGRICPAPGLTPEEYNPSASTASRSRRRLAPYASLFTVVDLFGDQGVATASSTKVSPAAEKALLEWCHRYGLLGLLLQRLVSLTVPWGKTGVDRVFVHAVSGWEPRHVVRHPVTSGGEPSMPPTAPSVTFQDLRTGELLQEPLERTWSQFIADPRGSRDTYVARPGTAAFWMAYGEPVQEFVSAARTLRKAVDNLREAAQPFPEGPGLPSVHNKGVREWGERELAILLRGTRLVPVWDEKSKRYILGSVSPSLLGTLALMAVRDLAGGQRLATCGWCGEWFLTTNRTTQFCTRTHYGNHHKKLQRDRKRLRAEKVRRRLSRTSRARHSPSRGRGSRRGWRPERRRCSTGG